MLLKKKIKNLENDIYELLNIDKNIIHSNVSFDAENYSIFPAVSYQNADTYLCKSWVSKQFNHTGKFIKKHKLSLILLSNPEHEVLKKYGVWQQKSMYGIKFMGVVRTTFLINPKGKINFIWEKVKVDNHVNEVIEKIKENINT